MNNTIAPTKIDAETASLIDQLIDESAVLSSAAANWVEGKPIQDWQKESIKRAVEKADSLFENLRDKLRHAETF